MEAYGIEAKGVGLSKEDIESMESLWNLSIEMVDTGLNVLESSIIICNAPEELWTYEWNFDSGMFFQVCYKIFLMVRKNQKGFRL